MLSLRGKCCSNVHIGGLNQIRRLWCLARENARDKPSTRDSNSSTRRSMAESRACGASSGPSDMRTTGSRIIDFAVSRGEEVGLAELVDARVPHRPSFPCPNIYFRCAIQENA